MSAVPALDTPTVPERYSAQLGRPGWLLLVGALAVLAWALPTELFHPQHAEFIFLIGAIGIWRYSLGGLHFVRALWFLKIQFPRLRRRAQALGDAAQPRHVFLLITSFRIDPATTARVYRAAIEEARRSELPVTLVASIVEMADQQLIKTVWRSLKPPAHLRLVFVRVPGTGKRDGLAEAFRAISRENPPSNSMVAVIDGDTALAPGVIRRCAPYFALLPKVGALTTNEYCDVEGGYWMREWHRLRFAQRHLHMCSMGLSRRVLTLTGRMSMFRAEVLTDPRFIHDVQYDALKHWRLGRFRFLTGDDKSSWYSLMRLGYDTFYVPDAAVYTMEHPPAKGFVESSRRLMFRWYGNSLRQNSRATGLGPRRLGWFTWYVLWDQRISMWTCLLGTSIALVASLQFGIVVLLAYAFWVLSTRLLLTAALTASGHPVGPAFPLLLYYNQIVGSLMKIYVVHRLDRQSWTRQQTVLQRELSAYDRWFHRWSSRAVNFSTASLFAAFVMSLF